MKIAIGVAWKLFLLAVACVPLVPPFVLYNFQSVLSCSESGVCFRSGHPFLNGQGTAIVYLSMIILWPMCAWQLIGKHIFRGRWRAEFYEGINRSRVTTFAGRAYWLVVASIPLLFWYLFGTFQAPAGCAENGDCFEFYAPLDSVNLAAVLVTICVLWPMCIWMLFARKNRFYCSDRKTK